MIELLPDTIAEGLNPETQGPVTPEEIRAAWQELSVLHFNNKAKIHVLRAEYTVNPGPRFVKTLKDIAQIIHPDTMPQ